MLTLVAEPSVSREVMLRKLQTLLDHRSCDRSETARHIADEFRASGFNRREGFEVSVQDCGNGAVDVFVSNTVVGNLRLQVPAKSPDLSGEY